MKQDWPDVHLNKTVSDIRLRTCYLLKNQKVARLLLQSQWNLRTDSYKALQEWLLANTGVKLSIRSRKYHGTVYKKLEKGFRDDPLLS